MVDPNGPHLQHFSSLQALNVATLWEDLRPVLLLLFAITAYAIFVYKFYHYLGKRDIIERKYTLGEMYSQKNYIFRSILYIVEYLIATPIIVAFWALVIIILLSLVSIDPLDQIILVSMAVVGAIRATAYYNETLSNELASMVPYLLLCVYISDTSIVTWSTMIAQFKGYIAMADRIIIYLLFLAAVEILLRFVQVIIDYYVEHIQSKDDTSQ